MPSFGTSNDLIVTHVTEGASYGVTPANPTLLRLRVGGETMTPGINYTESDEINPNYDLTDLIAVGAEAGGGLPIMFAKAGVLDDILAAVLRNTWATNVLKAGLLRPSFTLEKSFLGGGTRKYMSFPGSRYNGFTLEGAIGEKLSASLDVMSLSGIPATTSIVGTGSTTEPAANRIMSLVDMTSFAMTGDTTPLIVSRFSLAITNNCRRAGGHGQLASYDILYGMREVTLTFDAYFESWEQMTKLLNRTNQDLTFVLSDGTNTYTFRLPRLKFRSLNANAESNNSDLMQSIEARGLYDPTLLTSLQVTRA